MESSWSRKEISMEIPSLVRVYKDGSIERLQNSPMVAATPEDPLTSSKDVVISHKPLISARLFISHEHHHQHKLPILVYFHGGGFFFESAFNEIHHKYFNKFVSIANVIVVSVEYRLAPETLLPAAYEDCWDALKWVATNTDPWILEHGDLERLFIGGDSAGANIVHNIAMRAGHEPLPRGVKLLGAFLSHSYFYGSKPMGSEPSEGHEKSVPYLVWGFVYPNAPGGIDNPMINPMADGAPSLTGLGCSKIMVCVAEKDLLKDRGIAYYEAINKTGWNGQLQLFQVDGEDHAFHIHNPHSHNAIKMIKRFAHFLLQ